LGEVIEVLVFGFLISSLYALIAVGFTMIFGVAGVLNLAHGAFAIVGAYLAVWALGLGLGLPIAFLVAVVGLAIFAPLTYRMLIRPVERNPIIVFLVTLLFAVLLEQVLILLFGAIPRTLPPLVAGNLEILGSRISYNRLAASAIALIVMAALWLFVTRTKIGKAILALSMNRQGAALMGIPTERIILWVWAISGALAAIAGMFIGSFFGLQPLEQRLLLVIAFSIVVLGGLGSIPGSLWAAFIIGYAETIAVQFAPEARGLSSLVILILVLALRPQGLLGRAAA
jgi:branched-chain amino acid transport system permease protein